MKQADSQFTLGRVGLYHLKEIWLHRQVGPLPLGYMYHASDSSGVIYPLAATSVCKFP